MAGQTDGRTPDRVYCIVLGVSIMNVVMYRGVVLKKKWGTPETRLRQRFLGLHTRTLIHVRIMATEDISPCPAIQLLVFECL